MLKKGLYLLAEGDLLQPMREALHAEPYQKQPLGPTTTLIVYINSQLGGASSVGALRDLERLIANQAAQPFKIVLFGVVPAEGDGEFQYLTKVFPPIPHASSIKEALTSDDALLSEDEWTDLAIMARRRYLLRTLDTVRKSVLTHGTGRHLSLDTDHYWGLELGVLQGIQSPSGRLPAKALQHVSLISATSWRHSLRTLLFEPLNADLPLFREEGLRFAALIQETQTYLDSSHDALKRAIETSLQENYDKVNFDNAVTDAVKGLLEVRRFSRLFEEEASIWVERAAQRDSPDDNGERTILFVDDNDVVAWAAVLQLALTEGTVAVDAFPKVQVMKITAATAAVALAEVRNWIEQPGNAESLRLVLVDLAWPDDAYGQYGGLSIIRGIRSLAPWVGQDPNVCPAIAVLTNGRESDDIRQELNDVGITREEILHKDLTLWEELPRLTWLLSGQNIVQHIRDVSEPPVAKAEWIERELRENLFALDQRYTLPELEAILEGLDNLSSRSNEPEFLTSGKTELLGKLLTHHSAVTAALLRRTRTEIDEIVNAEIDRLSGHLRYNYLKQERYKCRSAAEKCQNLQVLTTVLAALKNLPAPATEEAGKRLDAIRAALHPLRVNLAPPTVEETKDIDRYVDMDPHMYEVASVVTLAVSINIITSALAMQNPQAIAFWISGGLMLLAGYLLYLVSTQMNQIHSDARSWQGQRPGEPYRNVVTDVWKASGSSKKHHGLIRLAVLSLSISILPLVLYERFMVYVVFALGAAMCLLGLLIANAVFRDAGSTLHPKMGAFVLFGAGLVLVLIAMVSPELIDQRSRVQPEPLVSRVRVTRYSAAGFSGSWITRVEPRLNSHSIAALPPKDQPASVRWHAVIHPHHSQDLSLDLQSNVPAILTIDGKVIGQNGGGAKVKSVHGNYPSEGNHAYNIEVSCPRWKKDASVELLVNSQSGRLNASATGAD